MAELKEVLKLYMKQSCTKISSDLPLSYQSSSTILQLPRSKITKCRKVCLHTSSGETDTKRRILKPLHHHYHIYRNPRRRRQRKVLHTTTTTTFTTEELRCVKTRLTSARLVVYHVFQLFGQHTRALLILMYSNDQNCHTSHSLFLYCYITTSNLIKNSES